jgi:hypothetical protein
MNNYQANFRTDILNTIFKLTGKTWLNILYAYLIYSVSFLILGGVIAGVAFLGLIDIDNLPSIIDNSRNPSPEEALLMLNDLSSMVLTPGFIVLFILLFIVVLVLASWNYYYAFIAVDSEVKDKNFSFADIFKLSINYGVVRVIGISLLINIIVVVLFFGVAMSSMLSGLLAFLLFIVASLIVFRLILVLPAYIIGNKDLNTSFAFSFHHINWIRALKLFGISILALIALMIVGLIISLITGMLSFIPFVGPIIQMGVNILLGAVMMTFMVSAVVGLYYRYAEDLISNEEESDASLLTELQE